MRKLTDVHDVGEPSLFLDSDMLFFDSPDEILNWMDAPNDFMYMQDAVASYGYSPKLMEELARGHLPERLNSGLYALPPNSIDYDYLEFCCKRMTMVEGPQYLQEQAMTALLFSGREAIVLPRKDYRVLPDLTEGQFPTAKLHHYVSHSKRSYFQHGWRRIVALESVEDCP